MNVEELSNISKSIKLGRYRHFKGGEYEVLGVGRMSENHEEEYVIYKSLTTGYTWLRPVKMFLEEVDKPEYNYKGPRFKFIDNQ